MESNFLDILQALAAQEVEFVVVGGVAANFHGSALSTFDCDIVVELGQENLIKLAQALVSLTPTFRHKIPPIPFDEEMAGKEDWKNIYLDTTAGILDCLGEIKGLGGFEECRKRSLEADLGGFSVRFLTRDALIAAKTAMGRPKDLLTISHLEVASEVERES